LVAGGRRPFFPQDGREGKEGDPRKNAVTRRKGDQKPDSSAADREKKMKAQRDPNHSLEKKEERVERKTSLSSLTL